MRLRAFLKDKWTFLLCQAGMVALLVALLIGLHFPAAGVAFFGACLLAVSAAGLMAEFFRKRRFYRALAASLERLDQKQYLALVLETPDFAEGEILCDVLRQTGKAAQDELAALRQRQAEYHEYIEAWIHEVKIPIACADLLCENHPGELADSLREELERIERYVEQALYYARSVHVEQDYSVRELQLDTLVKAAVKKHARSLIARNTQLQFDGLEQTVYCDPKWLDFILGQLIANSLQYTAGTPRLTFCARESGDAVLLQLRDNGAGIPPEDLPRVFDKGFTGENGRRRGKSTGIGLYLCSRLCRKLHLQLTAASTPGEGTTMTIAFPKDSRSLLQD